MMSIDDRLKAGFTEAMTARHGGAVAGGGGGPHGPDMEPRIAALEASAKETAQSLHRIELTLAELKPVLAGLPTKADGEKAAGALNTLAEKVDGLEGRAGRVEASVAAALTTAIGKSIGPWQLPGILGACVVVIGILLAGFQYITAHPLFAPAPASNSAPTVKP